MPCGVGGEALGCKIVTAFSNNSQLGLPSVMANILLHDPNTGQLKIILEGNTLTGLRTAAASVVATKELHSGEKCRLAILGAGIQAKAHAFALNHAFKFKENEKAKKLVEELRAECLTDGTDFQVSSTAEQCVRDADVICTTTYASEPILHFEWIKPGVHINAVGAGVNHHSELDTRTYQNSVVVTDSMASASEELKGLANIGVPVYAEIGQIINKTVKIPKTHCTIFHSLGR
ncbi:hypothetical protein AAG570_013831 [Ranatra chinensis]|uniref:Ketimine reductase mu-crystallin n=1 Tax=Ranatra chinensis TaxID=642074 RepID=A0ABD0YDI0_9HEMI